MRHFCVCTRLCLYTVVFVYCCFVVGQVPQLARGRQEAVGSARERLGAVGVPVEPRAQWPTGMPRLGVEVKGKIPPEEQAGEGRALARLSDLGWGQRLREVLESGDPVPEQVTRAVVQVLAGWGWSERPVGVVAMPSRRRPAVVGSLAEQISQIGRLPLLGTLELAHGGPVGEAGGKGRGASGWHHS